MSSRESSFCGGCSCPAVSSSAGLQSCWKCCLVVDPPGCSSTVCFSLYIFIFCLQKVLQMCNSVVYSWLESVFHRSFSYNGLLLNFSENHLLKTNYPKYRDGFTPIYPLIITRQGMINALLVHLSPEELFPHLTIYLKVCPSVALILCGLKCLEE